MRIIEACGSEIRAVGVSPDGRCVGASTTDTLGVFNWATGESLCWKTTPAPVSQITFLADGRVAYCVKRALVIDRLRADSPESRHPGLGEEYAGGVAVSPDGKLLIAAADGEPKRARLLIWSLPTMRPQRGYDDWAPFRKLAFSPNGQFVAGIWPGATQRWRSQPATFELRYAASGGFDSRYPPMGSRTFDTPGFISFTRDNTLCAFGWQDEFHVTDISTGTSRYVRRVEASFRDAAFTGSGQHLATVESGGLMKLWDPKTWQVAREYDWGCGALTCVAFTADGSAGVCGTADGKLVQFDVDE